MKFHEFQVSKNAKYLGKRKRKGMNVESWKEQCQVKDLNITKTWNFEEGSDKLVNTYTKVCGDPFLNKVGSAIENVWADAWRFLGHGVEHIKKMIFNQDFKSMEKRVPSDKDFEIPKYCDLEMRCA